MEVADYEGVGSANDVYVTDDHAYVADGVGWTGGHKARATDIVVVFVD